jgi:hypothetical protein
MNSSHTASLQFSTEDFPDLAFDGGCTTTFFATDVVIKGDGRTALIGSATSLNLDVNSPMTPA